MIRLSVYYPASEGARFDHDYYRDKHIPLCQRSWSPARVEIDRGLDGPYLAAAHLIFDSKEALDAAMASEKTPEILADVANYTTISPVLQTSEIVSG